MRNVIRDLRKSMAVLLALVMTLGLIPGAAFAAESNQFTDTRGHWAASGIESAVQEGLFTGVSDTKFDPDGSMTRAMLVTVMSRIATKLKGPTPTGAGASFTDVPNGAWYSAGVDWAVKAGITTGYGNGKFGPNDMVTREQMCVFMVRFLQDYMGYDLSAFKSSPAFSDDKAISSWAKESVYLAQAIGLVQGTGGNAFSPAGNASRATLATISTRLLRTASGWTPGVAPTPTPKPTASQKPGTGGDDGSGGGGGYTAITSVYILRDGVSVTGQPVRTGDQLSVYAAPDKSVYTISWRVGGVEKSTTSVYTVQNADAGSSINAVVTGTGSYTGTATSPATGLVVGVFNPSAPAPNDPVQVGAGTTYKDDAGAAVVLPPDAAISVDIAPVTGETTPAADSDRITAQISTSFGGSTVVPQVATVEVALTMSGGDTGPQKIHPIGVTTVTLPKTALGIASDVDIANYAFVASHTNKAGAVEAVVGAFVLVDGVQCVRFALNGLSRIYVGNIPPLTVTFDTDGGSAVASQKVKLGELAQRPDAPTKEGYLFAGWDYDLTVTKIISDVTFTAKWVKGDPVPDARLKLVDADNRPAGEQQPGQGAFVVKLSDDKTYTPDTIYTLQVTPYAVGDPGTTYASKYAISDTAQGALNATDLTDTGGPTPPVLIRVTVTNATGQAIPGTTTKYIKWTDAAGNLLALEKATVQVKTETFVDGDYDTQIRQETKLVDRGLGQVEGWLASSTGKPNLLTYVNGSLSESSTGDPYRLNLWLSAEASRFADIARGDYRSLKLVFTPFAGESYSGTPTVSARCGYGDDEVTVPVQVTLVGGKMEITVSDITPYLSDTEHRSIFFAIALNGKSQSLTVDLPIFRTSKSYVTANDWTQVETYLSDTQDRNITYTGGDYTLEHAVTVPENKMIIFQNSSLTIGQSGKLTLCGDSSSAAQLHNLNALTVANGGVLTVNAQNVGQISHYYSNINSKGDIVVASGGQVQIPAWGFLSLNSDSDTIRVERGATVTADGRLMCNSSTEIAGTLNITGNSATPNPSTIFGDVSIHGNLTLSGAVTITKGVLETMGGGTVATTGTITLNSGLAMLSGSFTNNGTLTANGGELSLANVGYSWNNNGTVTLAAGAKANAWGTVLVNRGTISGAGTLNITVADDTSKYDNGIEFVEIGASAAQTPDNYDRYKFTHDAAASVVVTYFAGKLSNLDSGTCTAHINDTTM